MKDCTDLLVIDDDSGVHRTLSDALGSSYSLRAALTGEEGLGQFERLPPDLVLLDVMLPGMSGMAVLRALKRLRADQAVIMMTAYAEVQAAVQAIKLGAMDYLQKPIDPERVMSEVSSVLARATATERVDHRARVIGESAAMKRAWRLVERFGPTDIPILLQGETGTGKGLMAEAIHRVSKRSARNFVALDCATIPEQLAESELFGYEDGAFTGAGKKRRGRVGYADGGTLFLDEIGTLALGTQSKLLTLIEQQSYLPLGARHMQPTQIDVRFICATNVPLLRAVDDGTFRADLFHRLDGVTIELPPLRDRESDIDLLAAQFVHDQALRHGRGAVEISPSALDALRRYTWPGNVRELQRVMSAAVIMADGRIGLDELPQHIREGAHAPGMKTRAQTAAIIEQEMVTAAGGSINLREIKEWAGREAQKRVIQELQKRTNITQQELARMLGVDPKTLRSRLKDPPPGH